MAIGDVDVAVWRHQNVGGTVELVVAVAGNARPAERHQHASVRAEFDGGLAPAIAGAAIGNPDVTVAVDAKTVRPVDQTSAEARDQFAAGIEFLNRGDQRTFAGLRAAAVVDPNTAAIPIDLDADRLAPSAAFGQLRPMFDDVIRIGRAVRIVGLDLPAGQCNGAKNGRADEADTQHNSHALAHGNSSLNFARCTATAQRERALFCRASQASGDVSGG